MARETAKLNLLRIVPSNMTPDQALFRITMFINEHGGADPVTQSALHRLEELVIAEQYRQDTQELVRMVNDCGHQCYLIGGPFIAEDPNCPIHNGSREY